MEKDIHFLNGYPGVSPIQKRNKGNTKTDCLKIISIFIPSFTIIPLTNINQQITVKILNL
jgi:hypothetical protein